jgi:hypothetical protein
MQERESREDNDVMMDAMTGDSLVNKTMELILFESMLITFRDDDDYRKNAIWLRLQLSLAVDVFVVFHE